MNECARKNLAKIPESHNHVFFWLVVEELTFLINIRFGTNLNHDIILQPHVRNHPSQHKFSKMLMNMVMVF